jgi:hypothetical protein
VPQLSPGPISPAEEVRRQVAHLEQLLEGNHPTTLDCVEAERALDHLRVLYQRDPEPFAGHLEHLQALRARHDALQLHLAEALVSDLPRVRAEHQVLTERLAALRRILTFLSQQPDQQVALRAATQLGIGMTEEERDPPEYIL